MIGSDIYRFSGCSPRLRNVDLAGIIDLFDTASEENRMSRVAKWYTALFLSLLSSLSFATEISYEIYDIAQNKIVAKGTRSYSKADVIENPYQSRGKQVVEKYVELESGFKVGARIFFEPKITGFGLVAQLTSEDFSWEWYNLERDSIFKKLQGGTFVEVRFSGAPLLQILQEVDFLDDTTLRFRLDGAPDETHEILIKKGSVLRFD